MWGQEKVNSFLSSHRPLASKKVRFLPGWNNIRLSGQKIVYCHNFYHNMITLIIASLFTGMCDYNLGTKTLPASSPHRYSRFFRQLSNQDLVQEYWRKSRYLNKPALISGAHFRPNRPARVNKKESFLRHTSVVKAQISRDSTIGYRFQGYISSDLRDKDPFLSP